MKTKKFIKISKTQWISSGIKRGHIIPKDNGSFTLSKKAQWGALAAAGAKILGSKALSAGLGGGVGVLGGILQNTNILQSAQDWWSGGSETPEMLKQLQEFKGRFDQEVKGRLGGISDRLDKDMERISAKIDERIATFTERLNAKGVGPAQQAGQKLLDEDELMANMAIAAQKPPTKEDLIYRALASNSSSSSSSSAPASAGASAGAPAPAGAPGANSKPTTGNTGGASALSSRTATN